MLNIFKFLLTKFSSGINKQTFMLKIKQSSWCTFQITFFYTIHPFHASGLSPYLPKTLGNLWFSGGTHLARVFSEVFHISKENITRLSINTLRFDVANLWSKLYFESINKETIFTKSKLRNLLKSNFLKTYV